MTMNNLSSYQKCLVQLFTDYMLRFGSVKRQEIEAYCQLSHPGICNMYAGNGKRGKKKGFRNSHISRFADENAITEMKRQFESILISPFDNQDSVRGKIISTLSPIKDIGEIVYNDLSYLTCLKYEIEMPKLYVQYNSYKSAKLIQLCYKKYKSSYFLVKKDNQSYFVPHEFISYLIGPIETYFFEDFLCVYHKQISYLCQSILKKFE